MKITYQLITIAGGNCTAVVDGQYYRALKQKINQKIFTTNRLVEQIGYLYRKGATGNWFFEMMGNEFSGNGCLAATATLLRFKKGDINFQTTGSKSLIQGQFDNQKAQTILTDDLSPRKQLPIKLLGTYFWLAESQGGIKEARKILTTSRNKFKAVGIIFFQKTQEKQIKINPFFYVRETKTIVNETACGSGSVAAAIYCGQRNLEVVQPTGESISVNLGQKQVKLCAKVELLGKSRIKMV